MKLPKTFIPKKSLEEKTKQLLEKPKKSKGDPETRHLYDMLKMDFPEFTEYIYSLYPKAWAAKTKDNRGHFVWKFYIVHKKATSPFLVCKIERYIEQCGKDTSEHGYHAKVQIEGSWHFIKYREGYYCFDSPSNVISTKHPLRYDKEKDIPFP